MTVTILHGDARAVLARLADDSIDCAVTSPPYFGLRSYLDEDDPLKPLEIGLEASVDAYVETVLEVFDQIRRVLRPEGTAWLNVGDSRAANASGNVPQTKHRPVGRQISARRPCGAGLKPKDLCLVPERLALGLQARGWWVRSRPVWGKPNGMPSSVKDRPTAAHEQVIMLAKSARCYYDDDATLLPSSDSSAARYERNRGAAHKYADGGPGDQTIARTMRAPRSAHTPRHAERGDNHGGLADAAPKFASAKHGRKDADYLGRRDVPGSARYSTKQDAYNLRNYNGFNARWDAAEAAAGPQLWRRLRDYEPYDPEVWRIAPAQFEEEHFATFPEELARRCIVAGCPPGGLVLDPFGGAGTTGLVADKLGRSALLVELDRKSVEIAERRIRNDAPLFAALEVVDMTAEAAE